MTLRTVSKAEQRTPILSPYLSKFYLDTEKKTIFISSILNSIELSEKLAIVGVFLPSIGLYFP